MIWHTHHDSLLFSEAKNSAIVLGAQRIFRLRCSLRRNLLRLASLLGEKIHWASKCVCQLSAGTLSSNLNGVQI